jgi:hypothetical protein
VLLLLLRGNKLTTGSAGAFLRRMRTLWMVVVVVLVGCGHKRVQVANTPEGNACNRQCMDMFNSCYDGKRKNLKTCQVRENECLRTCPGAVLGDQQEAATTAPAPSEATTSAPRCVASELPEWQGADATTKKKLMEQCRAPANP